MMNVLTDILCDTSSLLSSQGHKNTLSQSKMMSHDVSTKQGPLHLLDTVSHMSHIERPLSNVNDSSPSIDIFSSSSQLHIPSNMDSGFDDRSQVSVFSDQFPEIVPSWLTHDFMKVSDAMPSPGMLSNVSDIYPSRESEHLEMLDLGFPHELTSQDVSTNLNRACIDDNSQKLLAELPMQGFSSNNTLANPSFNGINTNQLHLSMEKNNMEYHKFKSNGISHSRMSSVIPCENELLHLPLPSNLTEQCLNSTSSPSMISNSQSHSHHDVVCDKLPQINLNHLDSLLGTETALSEIHLLRHDFPSVRMQETCDPQTTPCLTNCSTNRIISCNTQNFLGSNIPPIVQKQDISVQVPEDRSNISFGSMSQSCFSCNQVPMELPIDEIHCFKCRFCDYISVHKCAISNHINVLHSKPINSNLCLTEDKTQRSDEMNPLSIGDQNETHLSKSKSLVSSTLSNTSINVMSTERESANLIHHFKCVKCNIIFSEISEYSSHLMTHNIKPDGVLLNIDEVNYYQSLPANGILLNLPRENVAIKEINLSASSSILPQNNTKNLKKIPIKCKNLPKKSDDFMKKNSPKKIASHESSNTSPEKQLSSHKKAWQKKLNRELGTYICEFKGCNIRFRALDNLEYHKKCHISGGSSFACPECSMSFENWPAVAGHLWRKHSNDMELHACDQCQFHTYSVARLEEHKKTHKDEYFYLCDTCGKSFKTGKQLRNHRVIHFKNKTNSKMKPENCKCNVCGITFSNNRARRYHQAMVHNKIKPFVCNVCEYSASKRSTLRMHMRVHTGEKPFKCDKCKYETSDHNSLRRHKMKHSGEKPYKCPYCPYSSIQASTYKAHLKKHPDQGLMFSCSLCPFQTLKEDSYLVHTAQHENLYPPQRDNGMNEVNSTDDIFPIAEALDKKAFSWCK